jgi:hypothetical protein
LLDSVRSFSCILILILILVCSSTPFGQDTREAVLLQLSKRGFKLTSGVRDIYLPKLSEQDFLRVERSLLARTSIEGRIVHATGVGPEPCK